MIFHTSYAVECRYLQLNDKKNWSTDTFWAYLTFACVFYKLDARLFGGKRATLPQSKRHKRYYNMIDVCCIYTILSECSFVNYSCRLQLIFQKKRYNWFWNSLINIMVIWIWVFNMFLETQFSNIVLVSFIGPWNWSTQRTSSPATPYQTMIYRVHLVTCRNHNISGIVTDLLHWYKSRSMKKR